MARPCAIDASQRWKGSSKEKFCARSATLARTYRAAFVQLSAWFSYDTSKFKLHSDSKVFSMLIQTTLELAQRGTLPQNGTHPIVRIPFCFATASAAGPAPRARRARGPPRGAPTDARPTGRVPGSRPEAWRCIRRKLAGLVGHRPGRRLPHRDILHRPRQQRRGSGDWASRDAAEGRCVANGETWAEVLPKEGPNVLTDGRRNH